MNLPNITFGSEILTAKIESLIKRTEKVSGEYDITMSRVSQVEDQQDHRCELAAKEKELMAIIELFMRDDVRAHTVMDYVIVFVRLVLAKMRRRGHDFDDVKQLYKALSDETVEHVFRTVLSKLAFPTAEQQAIKVIMEALQHYKWPTSEVLTSSPGGDAQISSALLYVRLQQPLDAEVRSALQRALCAAHECILSDVAPVNEVSYDVNLNAANDVRKDDAYADARIKYEDYADFPAGTACISFDESFGSEAAGESKTFASKKSDSEGGDIGSHHKSATENKTDLSSSLTSEEEIKKICNSFAESLNISPNTSYDSATKLSDTETGKRVFAGNDDTPFSATHGGARKPSFEDEKENSSAVVVEDATESNVYVICYDASTSISQSDTTGDETDKGTEDIGRQVHHVTKVTNGKGCQGTGRETSDAATETEKSQL
ncbi:uncharacterized protein [Littorina saxatilis]|uniref:Uncharacterized protein n=1 Tax=Littorina saxatilis TaxID=31220 RepID=A0AAN9AN04_9CAEN